MKKHIFKGIRVLDFTQVISGSYVTSMLGDLGAEIIKIEPPVFGDSLRFAGPTYNGESGFFIQLNRNKKSISIDLKSEQGKAIVKDLLKSCHVLTQNFKPGVMESLGLGYEEAKHIKNDIIYVSISGYGQNNDYANRQAYDIIIQAETGLAFQNSNSDDNSRPLRIPLSISDYLSGMYGAFSVASALFNLQRTGQGQYIDIAMYDSLLSVMDNSLMCCDKLQDTVKKKNDVEKIEILKENGLISCGNRHIGIAPHGYYRAKDGYIAHMSLTNEMWNKLLRIIGREEFIADPDYVLAEKRKLLWEKIDKMIEAWTMTKSTDEIIKIFTENRLPCGLVRNIDQCYKDPHNLKRDIFQTVKHPIAGNVNVTKLPIKFSETPAEINSPAPLLGQHNYEILKGLLGYSDQQVDDLISKKVLYKQGTVD